MSEDKIRLVSAGMWASPVNTQAQASLNAICRKIDDAFYGSIERALSDPSVRSQVAAKVWLGDPVGWAFIRDDGSEVFRVTIVYDMEAMTATVVNTLPLPTDGSNEALEPTPK